MALLTRRDPPQRASLCAHHLFGRGPTCHTVLHNRGVSSEHASVYFIGGAWWVRDLGSRNGTYVGNQRLAPGEIVRLHVGQTVRFGPSSQTWHVEDGSPPHPCAWRYADDGPWGAIAVAADCLLQLPDDDDPTVMVYHQLGTGWLLESEGDTRRVQDQEVIEVNGVKWLLGLPPMLEAQVSNTVDVSQSLASAQALRLVFEVSQDEEHIAVVLHFGPIERRLRPRSHNEVLLFLARKRLNDREAGVSEGEAGWVYIDALADALRMPIKRLHLNVFRARKQLGAEGVTDAALMVEHRPGTRQLRIGIPALRVVPADRTAQHLAR